MRQDRWSAGAVVLFLTAGLPLQAQTPDLGGVWQGVEVSPGRAGHWPTMLTIGSYKGLELTAILYEEVVQNPYSVTFTMRGTVSSQQIQLVHTGILQQSSAPNFGWCQGTILLTYDAGEEKLSGPAQYRPDWDCGNGIFTLYRVRLKSAAVVPAATAATLRVSGQQVRWYADAARTQLLATGNTYPTRLTKTTTFYITQGFYPIRVPTATRITVQVAAAPVLKPPAKAAPRPAPATIKAPAKPSLPAPVVLPTVLFQTGTAVLLPASAPALDALVATLQARPTLRLRISGHTDQVGAADKNQLLSEQRAVAVRQYLVQKGTAAARLETVGYGHTRRLYPAPDARNRRVEIQELK